MVLGVEDLSGSGLLGGLLGVVVLSLCLVMVSDVYAVRTYGGRMFGTPEVGIWSGVVHRWRLKPTGFGQGLLLQTFTV